MKRLWKRKFKTLAGAALGGFLLLGVVLGIVFRSKMRVDGSTDYATYVAEVKTALTDLEAAGTAVDVPFEAAELGAAGTAYTIDSPLDFMALMVLSYEHNLEGYTFYIQRYDAGYDLRSVTIGDTSYTFKGIALNPDNPFKGNLSSTLGGVGIALQTSVPLFGYLDASARINVNNSQGNVVISLTLDDAPSGLALALVGSGTVSDSTIKNVNLSGTVKNENGCAGSIFGEIKATEAAPLCVESLGVTSQVTEVRGVCVGGAFGKVAGNVELTVNSSMWQDGMLVSYEPNIEITDIAYAAGGVIGEIEGNDEYTPEVTFAGSLTLEETRVVGAVYTGGVAGKVKNATLTLGDALQFADVLDISCNGGVTGTTYSGGFAGLIENTTLTATAGNVQVKTTGTASSIGSFAGGAKNSTISLAAVSFSADFTNGKCVGGFIGESSDSLIQAASLTASDACTIDGNITNGGGLIGKDTGSEYEITTVSYNNKAITVTSQLGSCALGGFAGSLDSTELNLTNEVTLSGAAIKATAEENPAANSIFAGGIIGIYTNNTSQARTLSGFSVVNLTIHSLANTNETFVGGILGAAGEPGEGGTLTISDCSVTTVTAMGSNTKMHLGGIVGGNFAPGTNISDVTAKLGQTRKSYSVGGVIAYTNTACSIQGATDMMNTDSRGSAAYAANFGGIVGIVDSGTNVLVRIKDISFAENAYISNTYSGGTRNGGIVGRAKSGTVVSLNGSIDLTNLKQTSGGNCSGYFASVVGTSEHALIYVNPTGYSAENGYEYGLVIPEDRYADEVGNYGSVYRNGNLDSDTPAANLDDAEEWLIQEQSDNTVVIKADTRPYALETKGDCARLSIALNTEKVFSGLSPSCQELLSGDYILGADIDLTGTGILTLNKNEDTNTPFTGSITSTSGEKYTITNSITAAHQGYLGLFSAVGDGASFSNMSLSVNIGYDYYSPDGTQDTSVAYGMLGKQHFGALASQAKGTITVNNVTVNTTLQEDRSLSMEGSRNKVRYYGGLFGLYTAGSGKTLTVKNSEVVSEMQVSEINHYAGGVIGYVNNNNAGGKIVFSNVTAGGEMQSSYRAESGADEALIGGLIACVGDKGKANNDAVDKKIDIEITDLFLNGMKITDRLAKTGECAYKTGGLIGYMWQNVEVLADGIYVGKAGDVPSAITVSSHTGGAVYGGLWNTVRGHMNLKDVAINAMNINVPGTEQTFENGLLVGNGQYLYLELENYTINGTNTVIQDAGALYFDEIVGFNRGTAENADAESGGVVSIKKDMEYSLYANSVVPQKNPSSRYYYNLAADLTGVSELSSNTFTVDSTGKMLQWSLAHYANTPLRQFFNISSSYAATGENVTFSGTIDLGDLSYYPVSVNGGSYTGSSAVIVFHGKTFDTNTTEWKLDNADRVDRFTYTYEEISEHHMLQSGLFNNVTQAEINSLTLKGTVTATEKAGVMYSGALVAGTICGVELPTEEGSEYINYDAKTTDITKIVLDNLSVSHIKADDWYGNYGLLVASVGSGAKVHLGPEDTTKNTPGVSMINYNSASSKAAAALIGAVGYDTAQGINLTFANMKIADVADSVTDASLVGREESAPSEETMDLSGAKVMAHASFIYNYQYSLDNTTGVYIFYLDDYKNQNVTLGEEIGDTVQFYDASLVQPIADYTADTSNGCLAFCADYYKPYVYQVKKIDVNPKNGNILKGCGTYDDPYVIETPSQLMTLYYYLSDYDRYKNTLLDWEINAFGTDTIQAGSALIQTRTYEKKYYNIGQKKDADDADKDTESTYQTLTEEGFPTIEQLSNAYYMITRDIDITLEDDFTGFGTEELPFTGVFVGRYQNESGAEVPDRQCEILMPSTSSEGASRYGFIKYAKGAVVRNLHLNLGTDIVKLVSNGTGAGVMAVVTGGDNIIDKVKVSGSITAFSVGQSQYNASYTIVGGYVGDLQKGSVILRNYATDALSALTIRRQGAVFDGAGTYQKGMIGKIQDGFVVDDENAGIAGIYSENPATQINSAAPDGAEIDATDTVNTADLDNSAGLSGQIKDSIANPLKTDKITVSQSETQGYNYQLNSAQDLLMLSFAINSGAMNYWGNEKIGASSNDLTAGIYGYDVFSRCRIQDYSYVGKADENDAAKAAYANVIRYDNGNPYTKDGTEDYICAGKAYGESFYKPYIFTYFDFGDNVEILSGTTYTSRGVMNQKIANTSGKEKYLSTYTLGAGTYDMTALSIKKCFKGIGAKTAFGLGNNPIYCSFTGNFVGAGSSYGEEAGTVSSIILDLDYTKNKDAALFNVLYSGSTNDACRYTVSGFDLKGNVKNTTVIKNENITAAGIAPRVYGAYIFSDVFADTLTVDCAITPDSSESAVNPETTVAAAFIARADYLSYRQDNTINFEDCGISQSTVKAWDYCGGFFAINATNGAGNTFTDCSIKDSEIRSYRSDIGGFAGNTHYELTMKSCTLESSSVIREYQETVLKLPGASNWLYGTGGFIGTIGYACQKALFVDCDIVGTADDPVSVSLIPYHVEYNRPAGGFVGTADDANSGVLQFENCSITNLDMEQRTASDVGGFVGQNAKRLLINQTEGAASQVTDLSINRYFQYCTGGIVGKQFAKNTTDSSKIANITVNGLLIQQEWEHYCYTGGVIGYHPKGAVEIKNVQIKGNEAHPVRIAFNVQKYNAEAVKLYIGGMVGYSENENNDATTTLSLENCSLEGTENEAGEYYVKLVNAHFAGGMIGYFANKNSLTINGAVVKHVGIQSVNTYESNSSAVPHGAAAGVVGKLDNANKNPASGAVIEDTEITDLLLLHYDENFSGAVSETDKSNLAKTVNKTISFGGIVGVTKKELAVKDFIIDGLSIGKDGYAGEAGGIIGMVVDVPLNIGVSSLEKNQIKNSVISAGVAGGIIGNTQKAGESSEAAAGVVVKDIEASNITVVARYLNGPSWDLYAGGITGRHEITDVFSGTTVPENPDVHIYENITLKNSVISSYRNSGWKVTWAQNYIGGFIGGQLENETRGYEINLENVLMGHLQFNTTANETQIPAYADVLAGNVQLYTISASYTESISFLQEALTAETHTDSIQPKYTLNMGMWFGRVRNVSDTYVVKAKATHQSGQEMYHPASDVGASQQNLETLLADTETEMYDIYDLYRKNIHLIYKEEAAAVSGNANLIGEKMGVSDYYFGQMENIISDRFAGYTADENTDYRLDEEVVQDASGKTIRYPVEDVLDAAYKGENGYLSPYEWNGEKIPMLVSAGKYDINTIINTAVNVLTNQGGTTANACSTNSGASEGKFLKVQVDRVKYQETQTDAPFEIIEDGKEVICYDAKTGDFSISETDYDSIDAGTFNLITIKYQHTDTKIYCLKIPVFVRETVKISTHMKGMEGSGYVAADVPVSATEPTGGYTEVNVELNSIYTLYSEFLYSSAREEYSEIKLNKSIYRTYENGTNVQPFDVGTRITMLDISNNNMVYFYEVTEENRNNHGGRIYLTDFVSMSDVSYQNGDVSDITKYPVLAEYKDVCNQSADAHTDIGMEQFLFIIDESGVGATTSTIYDLYVEAEEKDNVDLFKNASYSSPCFVRLNEIPELHKVVSGSTQYEEKKDKISLEGKSSTEIAKDSKISRDSTLGLSGTTYILSPSTIDQSLPNYWKFVKNSTRNQYLELAISLEDIEGNRVTVPDGTMITVTLDGVNYGTIIASASEYIYCYYDTQRGKADPSHLNLTECTGDIAVDFDVTFDFSSATDFSGIRDTTYQVTIEVLDTPDRDYPRNGKQCDSITVGNIQGINRCNLGFALEAEDILTLGMNAYNGDSTDKGRIAFTSRLDFSDYMDGGKDGFDLLTEEYSGKYFTYSYVLERKNTDGNYETFGYEPENRYDSLVKLVSGQSLSDWEEVPATGEADTQNIVLVEKTVQYTIDVNKEKTDSPVEDEISRANPIMEETLTLFANVEELLDDPENITNYKLTCYVTISDSAPTESETLDITKLQQEQRAEDFIIFTLAKLKTDME